MSEVETCPKCLSRDSVVRVKCRCFSCPPWYCTACNYDFFGTDQEDETNNER